MPIIYDLHSHSTVSDGILSPADLVTRAAEWGVDVLALTDHDSTAGHAAALAAASEHGLRLICGVEISVSWSGQLLHILGLNIHSHATRLEEGLAELRQRRLGRAQAIAKRLQEAGLEDAYERVCDQAKGSAIIGRAHFARELVKQGMAKDFQAAFRKYLRRGRPGYVACEWAGLDEAIGWIKAAGGVAVIAHPARYRLSRTRLRQLCQVFRDLGGEGIEVASGSHSSAEVLSLAEYAREFSLYASQGSDFHDPEQSWTALGKMPALPSDLKPVWSLWEASLSWGQQAV